MDSRSTLSFSTGAINAFKNELQKALNSNGANTARIDQLDARLNVIEDAVVDILRAFETERDVEKVYTLEEKIELITEYDELPVTAREAWYKRRKISRGLLVAWKRLKTQGKLVA